MSHKQSRIDCQAGIREEHRLGAMRRHAVVVLLLLLAAPLWGQSGGTQPIFVLGAGARAIGVGSAMVAMPLDATTVYWNAGGLDLLERKNLVLFYSPLLGGTKYNFVGYAHPTLQFGTFGIGWLHWDVGEVPIRGVDSGYQGDATFGHDQLLIAYGKQLPIALSVGGAIKLDRQTFTDVDPATGVAIDLGLVYRPDLGEGLLQDLAFGFTVQNLIEPRLKFQNTADKFPRMARIGMSKPIQVNGGGDVINLFLTYQSGGGGATGRMQMGTEYVYQNRAMLRLGRNGSGMSFGAGLVYQNFEIDYALGKYSTDEKDGFFGPQHRVGITMHLGKSKAELIEAARQKENERIEKQTMRELHLKHLADFSKLMDDGKVYYQRGDYFQGLLRFNEAVRIFPSDEDAQIWANKAREKFEEQQRAEAEEREKFAAAKAARAADSAFVAAQIASGMRFFEAGEYREAIREWEIGLKRVPDNAMLQSLIDRTKGEMDNRVSDMLRRARDLESRGRLAEAVQAYNRVLNEGALSANQKQDIGNTVTRLQTQLNVKDLVAQGVAAYHNRDYNAALGYFQEVLKADPNNALARKYIFDAESRLEAKLKDFASERLRQRFTEAARLSQSGNYEAALRILEEIQKEDRYNKRILDAIDQARDKLNRK